VGMDVYGAHALGAHPLAFRSLSLALEEHVANPAHRAGCGSRHSGLEYTPSRDAFSAITTYLLSHWHLPRFLSWLEFRESMAVVR
jgi:hypothetical protein